MSQFKIEKGIPIPPASPPIAAKYPWADMEPGDSIFLPKEKGRQSCPGPGKAFRDKNPTRLFTTRATIENGVVTGWRVWREF